MPWPARTGRTTVEAEASRFWDEVAAETPRNPRVVRILRDYNAAMSRAGRPYRYT